ncbi:hypothetical protein EYC80_009283 [Monilinia laxa]|uniref:Uncharacterized protein n=1 Tax=Monilinia laxa TaxID=61186 RepID=A0A5N6JXS2_MONLA|nr:hypothetical protein EYC80_009283 [Monilinia laxa]
MEGGELSPYLRLLNEAEAVRLAKAAIAAGNPSNMNLSETANSSTELIQEEHFRQKGKGRTSSGKQRNVSKGKQADFEWQHARVIVDESEDDASEVQAISIRKVLAQKKFKTSMGRLNKKWEAQQIVAPQKEATPQEKSIPPQPIKTALSENNYKVKIHNGTKYTKRSNGLFVGQHVEPPQFLTIDGEDHVEYRVLTKSNVF